MSPFSVRFRHPGRVAFVFATIAALAGCGGTAVVNPDASKKIDYGTPIRPPLEVPPDLVRPAGSDSLAPTAPGSGMKSGALLPEVLGVRLERAGTERWLVVDRAPDQVWPQVREFVNQQGLAVAVENPNVGVIETDWAENRRYVQGDLIIRTIARVFPNLVSSGLKDSYRIRIERGTAPGTSEIYLSHRGMEEYVRPIEDVNTTVWRPRPSDPELEAEMLRLLMLHLGVPAGTAVAKLAQPGTERAQLITDANSARLLLRDDDPARAWRRVGVVLDRLDVVVENRDRARASYVVRYNDPAKQEPGFFAKMFEKAAAQSTGGDYQIDLSPAGGGVEVRITPRNGANPANARQILAWLHDQLK